MFILKRAVATFLTALMIISNIMPLQAQVMNSGNNEYEVIPPVNNSAENNVTSLPDVQGNTASTMQENQNYANTPYPNQMNNSNTTLQGRLVTAPRGTNFEVVTNSSINSMSARVGDVVSATLEESLIIDGKTVIPAGSEMRGQVSFVESAGRVGKNAMMDVRFTSVKLPSGDRVPINAKIITTDSSGVLRGGNKSNIILKAAGTTAGTTAAGAVAGLSAGAILGSCATGVLFGTAVGGLAGIGYALYRKGKDIILPSGTKLGVTLEQNLTLSNSKPAENY